MHKKEGRRKQPLFFVLLWNFTKLVETLSTPYDLYPYTYSTTDQEG
ncbi:hypothetical protein SRCM100730_01387 [Bacillus velezensis]|uniref:Uncharacterized protein n=2 Tax=Bacillus velezensis TaxID=492670 RepID=I2CAY5_BACAY|nr:hypothetical protein MUS_3954 [Bacillus velezensis YAU B9601-Y2]ASB54908.1 hypothetical protein S100072_03603 [Bacillus velezensis]ERH54807.1 hypothetical protein O205_11150 [Bacillus amyloliquefaciens EGD-AQ14]OBR33773.1 hypothetical protein SRCM100731_01618 [Bacillus velezensis]OCB98503.1 hypothetical protein SRCM100730_01387 [Bacillus velezensis]